MKKSDLLASVLIGIAITMTVVGLFMLGSGLGRLGRDREKKQAAEEYVSSMPTLAVVETGHDLALTLDWEELVFAEGFVDNVYTYDPKPDITVHELALILPVFLSSWGASMVEDLPPEANRHFRREPPEKEDK